MALLSRRQLLAQAAAVAATRALRSSEAARPFRGIFIIMATPFTESGGVDYEDLEREVSWLDRCGVQGMVWPQLASEYMTLTKEERLHGMEVIARAAKGKKPALLLGVQAPDTAAALEYVRQAEKVGSDAIIAMPPTEAKSLDDFREYYRAIGRAAHRPLCMQTTGGARGIAPTVEFVLDLARELPNFRYVKEEFEPVVERMTEFARHRDLFQGVFSGSSGKGMLYEMSLGFDGTMPGAPLADIYAQIWSLYQEGRRDRARDLFAKLLLMLNTEQEIAGSRRYMMKKRGVFKTTVSRRDKSVITPAQIKEIEFQLEALQPYLKV